MATQLVKEFNYFNANSRELVEKHRGKVVIKGETILGFFDSMMEAISETSKKEELGSFLVKKCEEESLEQQHFHSRVKFN